MESKKKKRIGERKAKEEKRKEAVRIVNQFLETGTDTLFLTKGIEVGKESSFAVCL